MARWLLCLSFIFFSAFLISCSEAPSERAARHESRGDRYVEQEKFREADHRGIELCCLFQQPDRILDPICTQGETSTEEIAGGVLRTRSE